MRIASINVPVFKGLWEVKDSDYHYSGVTNDWCISYIYHPFKDEFVSDNKAALSSQVPKSHMIDDQDKFVRHYYGTSFQLGDNLDMTKDEFVSDKQTTLDTLGEKYAESPEDLPAEKFFNDQSLEAFYNEQMESLGLENSESEESAEDSSMIDEG